MQFTVNRAEMLSALQSASGVSPTKTTKDILRSAKVVVGPESLSVIATDCEIGLVVSVACISSESGECLLPIDKTVQILGASKDESIDFIVDSKSVVISSALSEFRMATADASEYPPLPSAGASDVVSVISGGDLVRLLNRTAFACDDGTKNYALGGVKIEVSEHGATFVATDTKRMPIEIASARSSGAGGCVLPAKAVKVIQKLDPVGDVEIQFGHSSVVFKCGNAVLSSRLVEGRFPDWRKVVPTPTHNVELVCGPFLDAVRRSMIMVSMETRGVLFQFSSGQLRLSSSVADLGQSRNDVPIGYVGDTVSWMLDPVYIADMLRQVDSGDQVSFGFIDEDKPILLTCGDYRYVVMPMAKVA